MEISYPDYDHLRSQEDFDSRITPRINLFLSDMSIGFASLEKVDDSICDLDDAPMECMDWFYLRLLKIDKTKRGKGFGGALLDKVTDFSEKTKTPILVRPIPLVLPNEKNLFYLDYPELFAFYKRHGFTDFENEYFLQYEPRNRGGN